MDVCNTSGVRWGEGGVLCFVARGKELEVCIKGKWGGGSVLEVCI